ncbi:hypothetical protein TARUN_2358 [Trichoderma arundinaceum]|uniref:Uncharacterized protein n=1 Tax=Trichoderma arundinaceum TaxID=490622 RepID=A0A395NUU1_TRIAR|nr:hypothetical protein TARUN_2358 [Trichoderma arundinaceum]
MMPTPLSPSQPILPPGAPSLKSVPPRGLCLRVVFYGHASHEHNTPPLCVTNATYADSVPSRDGLLADVASWAGLHGLSIRHAGGRIDPSKAKLYILPRGSPGGGLLALEVVPGGGLAMPGDVIKVVRLEGVEERVWEETLRDVRREGYEGVVAVDMSASSSSSSDATGDSDTTATDEAPAPAASVVDADANADTGVAAST